MAVTKSSKKALKNRSKKLKKLSAKYPYLKNHLIEFNKEKDRMPEFVNEVRSELKFEKDNIIYRVNDEVFAHAYAPSDEINRYYAIEPKLKKEEKEIYNAIKEKILQRSTEHEPMNNPEKYRKELKSILNETTEISEGTKPRKKEINPIKNVISSESGFIMSQDSYDRIWYALKKDLVGLGPIDPITQDKRNEDIHVLGYDKVNVNHNVYGMMRTDVDLGSDEEYKNWLETITQRVGNPVSSRNPIVDTTLPDGSRLNIVYSEEVSVEGPTLTIRQFEETPLSIMQIIQSGTFTPELAAYMWLALESNMSIAVCGETASGKTTSLNAMTALIPRDTKIYTAEDTLEVRPPHSAWQRLLTRETGGEAGEGVDLFNLVKNSLRSRPGYIIVGEVRGKEGFNVFQAMQTGHPVIFTFHAGSVTSLIDRFTGDPINVPIKFFDNLDIVIFQNFIKSGGEELRRVTNVHEIEGYSGEMEGIVTRGVFERDPSKDELDFTGYNNSYILEKEVASTLGYNDERAVYPELDERAEVLKKAIREGYTSWDEAVNITWTYQEEGKEGLPFIAT